jgi:predicted ATP-dependent protease
MAGHPMMPMPSPGIHPGGDNFEQHLHALERFFDSPFIRRHLELIAENTHLKAQLEMQERLHMQQRERQPDRAAQERAERERAERERAERGRSESAQREARGGNEAEKLRDQVAQLEGQLQDMRAASEKAQRAASEKAKRAIIEMTEQREQWMRKMHAEMEQRMQEALRRAGVDGKPRESSGDRPKRKEAD